MAVKDPDTCKPRHGLSLPLQCHEDQHSPGWMFMGGFKAAFQLQRGKENAQSLHQFSLLLIISALFHLCFCLYRRAGQTWKAVGQFGAWVLEAEEHGAPCQAKTWADAGVLINDSLDSLGTDKGQLCSI